MVIESSLNLVIRGNMHVPCVISQKSFPPHRLKKIQEKKKIKKAKEEAEKLASGAQLSGTVLAK